MSAASAGEWAPEEQYLFDNLSDPAAIAKDISEKAVKIWKILDAALWKGVQIRWFSVDHESHWLRDRWMTEGEPGDVTIINAVEVTLPTIPPEVGVRTMVELMRMTVQNERALAVYLWGPTTHWDRAPGALIWSDGGGFNCDLSHLPWTMVGVMTGPHHGSEKAAHTAIWQHAFAGNTDIDVVLAGGSGNQKPHAHFESLPRKRKRTTQEKVRSRRRYTDVTWSPFSRFRK